MPSNRNNLLPVLLVFFPNPASAHGQEVLLFPIGTLVAIAAILLVSLAFRASNPVRVLASAMAIAVSVPFWLVPGSFFPPILRFTGWGNFIIGFLPSLLVGYLVLWLNSRRNRSRNGA